ncbi:unannotated protein [freshwater metagenome]|uniref:Unannotated protein n=1 Tax=freshwater metagenome TaxID=449393 RepID=A0A6J7NHK3_9ZZZZ
MGFPQNGKANSAIGQCGRADCAHSPVGSHAQHQGRSRSRATCNQFQHHACGTSPKRRTATTVGARCQSRAAYATHIASRKCRIARARFPRCRNEAINFARHSYRSRRTCIALGRTHRTGKRPTTDRRYSGGFTTGRSKRYCCPGIKAKWPHSQCCCRNRFHRAGSPIATRTCGHKFGRQCAEVLPNFATRRDHHRGENTCCSRSWPRHFRHRQTVGFRPLLPSRCNACATWFWPWSCHCQTICR